MPLLRHRRLIYGFVAIVSIIVSAVGFALSISSGFGVPTLTPAPGPPHPATSLQFADEIVSQLERGKLTLSIPTTMKYGESANVELVLTSILPSNKSDTELAKDLSPDSLLVKVSNRMIAEIAGTGLEIQELTSGEQVVTSLNSTTWKWSVTPTHHGTARVNVGLFAYVDINGFNSPYATQSLERDIDISINPLRLITAFVQNNWKWLWTSVLAPVAAYYWRKSRKES